MFTTKTKTILTHLTLFVFGSSPLFAADAREPTDLPFNCISVAVKALTGEAESISYDVWVPRAQAGDDHARQVLAANLILVLHKFFLKRVLSAEDREDLVQETLIQIFRNLHKYDSKWKFTTWYFRVARSVFSTWKRAKNTGMRSGNSTSEDEVLDKLPQRESDAATAEDLEALFHAISLLPELERSVITQSFFTPSVLEGAAILGMARSTYGKYLNLARKQVFESLRTDPVAQSEARWVARTHD